jgi:hypothetical protein
MNAIIITSEQRDELVRCIQSKITAIQAKLRWMDRRDAISPPPSPGYTPYSAEIRQQRLDRIERLQQLLTVINPESAILTEN